jgi:hypothetical protein
LSGQDLSGTGRGAATPCPRIAHCSAIEERISVAHRRLALIALAATGLFASVASAAAQDGEALVPDCRASVATPSGLSSSSANYTSVICGDEALLGQARRIKAAGDALLTRLLEVWRPPFSALQEAFPKVAYACPRETPKLTACIALAMEQRLRDIADLAANFDADLSDCKPSDLQIEDTDLGDAGMSKSTTAYVIDYKGNLSCRLRGYPTIAVTDSNGVRQWTYAAYAGEGSYVKFAGPPLPVTLSAKNPQAWFSLSSSSGCDAPSGKPGYSVDVAPPISTSVLKTIKLEYATCPTITVTPIGMISSMRAALN